jgi:GWxTD domain-containing protein
VKKPISRRARRGLELLLLACAAAGWRGAPATAQEPAPAGQAAAGEADRLREQVTFDVVRLYGVEGKTLVEIYSRIPTSVLTFTENGGRWEASLSFRLTVADGDSVVLQDSWTRTKTVADKRMLDSSRVFFVETHAFLVPPGTYRLDGAISDADGKELGGLRQTLEAPADNPPASDLLLASQIVADTASAAPEGYDPVRKNRLVLNPNPDGVFSTATSPLVYFYYEFRNVAADPLPLVRVLRFRGQPSSQVVKEVRTSKTYLPGWTVDFGAVNVAGLPQGSYTLEIGWEGEAGAALPEAYRDLARAKDFVLVREKAPALAGEVTDMTDAAGAAGVGAPVGPPAGDGTPLGPVVDYYQNFSEAQLDSIFDLLDVFFRIQQKKVYKGLTPDGKKAFLNEFWASRDETRGTPDNPFRDEIDHRLEYIQKSFRSPVQEGYETPLGQVYLKNGRPDKRLRRQMESGFSVPYEIWIYYSTGYRYFFMDQFRNGRYILLTSTDPEVQGLPDWEGRVTPEAAQEYVRE